MEGKKNSSTLTVKMNGGDGVYSYAHNSSYQRKAVDGARGLIREAIADKFDVKQICSSSPSVTFFVADLGCSVGPNTFIAMQNIIDGIQHKYQSEGLGPQNPEFQVYFNDHVSNDFNKLFASFPPNKNYFAAAVPGSFSNRLFPKQSLHFVHSSTSLQWLSKVPKQVEDVNSPAFNKGRISYGGAPEEVTEAYLAQFIKDMGAFFAARAEEVVPGGLMALIIPTRKFTPHPIDVMGSCIAELTKKGVLSEAKLDSFNMPVYVPSIEEFENTIKSNGSFSIEISEVVGIQTETNAEIDAQKLSLHVRAAFEGIVSEHFGSEHMDELYSLFAERAAPIYKSQGRFDADLFVLLKRK